LISAEKVEKGIKTKIAEAGQRVKKKKERKNRLRKEDYLIECLEKYLKKK